MDDDEGDTSAGQFPQVRSHSKAKGRRKFGGLFHAYPAVNAAASSTGASAQHEHPTKSRTCSGTASALGAGLLYPIIAATNS
jgi:hypothetical protein